MNRELDIASLARDDLENEFRYLQEKCKQLLESSEEDAQRIHELKRNLETANAAEQFLAQELEQLTSSNVNANTDQTNNKIQFEFDEMRRKYKLFEADYSTLQEDYDSLVAEHAQLRSKWEQINAHDDSNVNKEAQADNEKLVERLQVLEQDNMELLHKFEEQRADIVKQSMLLAEKERQVELARDELNCVQENLRYKREELDEKTNLLESTQEQLCEANAKINMLMSAPENKDRKGNSLFAEVDDQRQAMIKLLATQKKSYNEMKKIYNDSQYEIRRLQRENSAMHTELQACSSIFRNADRTYQEKLNGRIRYLVNENEDLEKKLQRTQEHLKDVATSHDVSWLNSMLDFCKKETSELKIQLYSVRIQNASLEEQIRNLQQDLARWRFESLKSRCLLTDRENLLNQHKITFKPQSCVEYNVTDEEIQNARPRIVPIKTPNVNKIEVSAKSTLDDYDQTNVTSGKSVDAQVEPPSFNLSTKSIISINDSILSNDKENESQEQNISVLKSSRSPLTPKCDSKQISPRLQIKTVETLNKDFQQLNTKEQLPSILCTHRDFMAENEKKVQFATNEATVFNLSASLSGSDIDIKSDISMDGEKNISEVKCNTASAAIKTVRTKSNVVVRRIVVKSKPK